MKQVLHPNMLLFMGGVTKCPHLSIVTEYLGRSLFCLINKAADGEMLDLRGHLHVALDVAKGINYLHCLNPPTDHLKTPNMLVDKKWFVKEIGARELTSIGITRQAGQLNDSIVLRRTPQPRE